MLSWLRLSYLCLEPPNDFNQSIMTWKHDSYYMPQSEIWSHQTTFKLKSDKCNWYSIPNKSKKRHITCPKGDFVKELCFQVTIGHLRSFGGHLVAPNSNLRSTILSVSQEIYKRHYMPPMQCWGLRVGFPFAPKIGVQTIVRTSGASANE